MLHEHEEGRSLIRGMLASLPDATEAKAAAVARFVQSARGFVAHLRLHILKEDSRLFPMADHALTEDDQERLLEVFGHKEEHDLGAGTHEKYLELARELAKQFQVATASGSSLHVVCGSCGH
jgi:hemerythrin-like domain-containing protein